MKVTAVCLLLALIVLLSGYLTRGMWTFETKISLGDVVQAISLPVAIGLAFIPIAFAIKERKRQVHLEQILGRVTLISNNAEGLFQQLTFHQQGTPCENCESLSDSRKILAAKRKHLALREKELSIFLPENISNELAVNAHEWWVKLTDSGIVSAKTNKWKDNDGRLHQLTQAHETYANYLALLAKKCIKNEVKFWS